MKIVLLDALIVYFFFGNWIMDALRPARSKRRYQLKCIRKGLEKLRLRDGDILSQAQNSFIDEQIKAISAVNMRDDAAVNAMLEKMSSKKVQEQLPKEKSCLWLRNNYDTIAIALALAFGIRALFIQPFMIPTGSMQPTLWGVHYFATDSELVSGRLKGIFNYLNYGRKTLDVTVSEDGYMDLNSFHAVKSMPFSSKCSFHVGRQEYIVSGTPDRIKRILFDDVLSPRGNIFFRKGETLLHGYLCSGDHLFVNRFVYDFREPRRGDITVFITEGLNDLLGHGFGGRFYVKRLVGLPGDTLKISGGKLYIKEQGADDFHIADDCQGFDNVHGAENGYNGYVNFHSAQYLRNENETFTVPENEYFMLGDNSRNSLDSRFWGTVPRRNLVGTVMVVWWPFAEHWGFIRNGVTAGSANVKVSSGSDNFTN